MLICKLACLWSRNTMPSFDSLLSDFYLPWYHFFAFLLFGSQRGKSLTNFVHPLLYLKRSLVRKTFYIKNALLGCLCLSTFYFLEHLRYRCLKTFLINEAIVLRLLAWCLKFLFHLHLIRLKSLWRCQRLSFLFYWLLGCQNLCRAQFLTITWGYLGNHLFFCLHCCLNCFNNTHSKLLPILPCHLESLLARSIKTQRILAGKRQNILPHLEVHSRCLDLFPLCLELAWRHLEILRLVP